jgi:hypothetical protein
VNDPQNQPRKAARCAQAGRRINKKPAAAILHDPCGAITSAKSAETERLAGTAFFVEAHPIINPLKSSPRKPGLLEP